MNILGFEFWRGLHDASAALVMDGKLVAAVEQERFSRRKHDGSVPLEAIAFCLQHAGITLRDIDVVAFPSRPYRSGPDSEIAEMDVDTLKRLRSAGAVRRRALVHKHVLAMLLRARVARNRQMNAHVAGGLQQLRDRFGALPRIRFYGHHEAHAAVAFLTSEHDRAAVVTADGRGGPFATVVWEGRGTELVRLRSEPYTNSLGRFYEDCTRYLGFGQFGEGKAMGLAPYGSVERFRRAVEGMLNLPDTGWYVYRQPPSPELLGVPARRDEAVEAGPYADFAAAMQQRFERAMERIASSAIELARSDHLCMSGGVLLNCSSNGRLAEADIGASRWVFPAAGDGGLSVGAALLCAAEAGELRREPLRHAYWGPEFGEAECAAAIRADARVTGARCTGIERHTAELLASGNIVGWVQGRMELGPRALGNRSILADPRTVAMRDRVNRVKRRELWRPLAPVVTAERATDYFALAEPSPFMLFAAQVRPAVRARIPAIVHVDGSARPQTVEREQNARLHSLLTEFERLTGVPVLLNTSFNDAGEPIVCTPADALRTFLATDLDVLVLGDFLVRRVNPGA